MFAVVFDRWQHWFSEPGFHQVTAMFEASRLVTWIHLQQPISDVSVSGPHEIAQSDDIEYEWSAVVAGNASDVVFAWNILGSDDVTYTTSNTVSQPHNSRVTANVF